MKSISKKITFYCDKLIIGLLLASVIIIPLFFDIRLYRVFDLSKVTALYLLTIAILVIWSIILVLKHDFKFSYTPLDIPIIVYIFLFIISSVTSINPIMSLFGTYKRFEGLTATLCYIVVFYTTFWLTNTRACFVALLGGLCPLLFLIFKLQTKKRYKFIVLVVSFTLVGMFFNVRHETSVIKHFAGDVSTTKSTTEKSVFGKTQTRPRPWIANKFSVEGSTFSRIFQYLAATRIIKDYPALGIGPDTIGIVYQKNLAKIFSMLESDAGFRFPRQDRIHNDTLDTAVTRGIFGLGTYIWLLTSFGVYVGRKYKLLSLQNKMLLLGLLTGIICYLIQNEFSFGNTPIVTLFWIMMGLCISIIKINETEISLSTEGGGSRIKEGYVDEKLRGWEGRKPGSAQLPKFPSSQIPVFCKWVGCGIVITAIGFSTVFILRFYRADAYFEYGRRILDYEKENLPAVTEKGLFFMKHAIRLNPYETFYRDELCRTYIQIAFKTKDEAWIQKAYAEAGNSLKLIPQHYMGFFHLGMIQQFLAEHFNRNTTDSAISYYKKAIDSDPFQAHFHSNLASLYINKGNQDQAIEELSQAYLIRPGELNHADRLANAYLQKGDLEKAIYFSRKTVALNPSEPGYYNNLGAVLSKKGMYEEAINAFKTAMEINPKEPIYLDNLLKLYLSLEKYDELIPYYKKLIVLDPSVADYHNNLGAIYKRKKQPKDAIESFLQAVTLKPDNPIYTHNLASGYVDLGKYAEAIDILQTFNKTYPSNNYINIHLLLADLYLKDTDWEKVASACEQAIKLDEKSIAAYKMLGMAYYNMHKYEFAEKMLNKTLMLDPNDQGAKDLIAKISNKVKKDL